MKGTTVRELERCKALCKHSRFMQIAIVTIRGTQNWWYSFIENSTSVFELEHKPGNSPFECNPKDAAEAWKILSSVSDIRHARRAQDGKKEREGGQGRTKRSPAVEDRRC
jgi:hypothetical protein